MSINTPIDSQKIDLAIKELASNRFLDRIESKDASIWSGDPNVQKSIDNRLGWLDAPLRAQSILPTLQKSLSGRATEGFSDLLFLGMGGSSVFARILEGNPSLHGPEGLKIKVLDSLNPDQVDENLALMESPNTLILVGSKSGTTVETLNLARIAESKGACGRMIALTDPGSPLEKHAQDHGYRATFLSWADIGGRFSPLTVFGLVPAILVAMDVEKMVEEAVDFRNLCLNHQGLNDHPAIAMGAVIGASVRSGTEVLKLPQRGLTGLLAPLLEQLLAESLGKQGKGLWPLFEATENAMSLNEIENVGLGGEIFRWQFITATTGAVMELNPFDEPDVALAKTLTREALEQLQKGAGLPWPPKSHENEEVTLFGTQSLEEFCDAARANEEVISILLYLPVNAENESRANILSRNLSARFNVPTMVGFGPRYLHATGQLHKGGNNRARHIVITSTNRKDVQLNEGLWLSELSLAQALADVQALHQRERNVAHVHLKANAFEAMSALEELFL